MIFSPALNDQMINMIVCKFLNRQAANTLFLLLNIVFFSLTCLAQQGDSLPQVHSNDSTHMDFVSRVKKIGAEEVKRSTAAFREGRVAIRQDEVIESIVKTTQKLKDYLKAGIDTFGISAELDKINKWYAVISDGVFVNTGSAQTNRNLVISSQLLRELIYKTALQKNRLQKYYRDLVDFRDRIDSLSSDSALYDFPSDSAAIAQYLQKIRLVSPLINPADSSLRAALVNINVQQSRVNLLVNMLNSRAEEIEMYHRELSAKTFDREFSNLGDSVGFSRPLGEIIRFSKAKGIMALWFYASDNAGKIFVLLLLIMVTSLFLTSLKEKIRNQGMLHADHSGQLILRYPVLSAIMIVLNLFQFFFIDPPFIFNVWFWIISALCLTVIFWNYISSYWMMVWFSMFFLFLLACADNVVLQASRTERWYMIILAMAGVVCGSFFLFRGNRKDLREKAIVYFIAFVVLLEIASVVANIYGRYNLSKTLLTSGYFNVIIAISFLWSVRMINEALSHAVTVYKSPERKSFYINFEKVGSNVPFIFYVLLVIGWFVLFARNFYAYRLIAEPFEAFLFEERQVGDYSFTIKSVLIFFMILVIAALVSKIVSFFVSENGLPNSHNGKNDKTGIGSWLLLVRIAIISSGLFLAFAAAGIPMDRITIILGALSVGIGFGLQTVINNLVSGLIIAFEKPVNVGDIVEIAGQSGTMKSIGFRSSIISTWDGADVVIPNGDLLNQHLVNWTMGNTMRRVDIIVGVAYGTDLEKTKAILNNLLASNKNILKNPEPIILFNEFNNSSIDIRILFWVQHFRVWIAVKSEVVGAIDLAFKEHGITIPFPQRDVHLYTAGKDVQKNPYRDNTGE